MTALVWANALAIPLADESVDLIVTSPPYFNLRAYTDDDGRYDGQIGSEPTPQAFLEALWEVLKECWRVLKPTGSCWINLGDKRAASGGHTKPGASSQRAGRSNLAEQNRGSTQLPAHMGPLAEFAQGARNGNRRSRPLGYVGYRAKTKLLLPHRFAIGCMDGLADPEGVGWIVRQDQVWHKANGMPESATDRTRDAHEFWFHLTKQGSYFSAMHDVRTPQVRPISGVKVDYVANVRDDEGRGQREVSSDPLGKLPDSVWTVPTEPLTISDDVRLHYNLPEHFAAFPTEWPRRLILGWSPPGICTACGEGRWAYYEKTGPSAYERLGDNSDAASGRHDSQPGNYGQTRAATGTVPSLTAAPRVLRGYACACTPFACTPLTVHPEYGVKAGPQREYHFDHWTPPPTRQAVVLDPFVGTGTTVGTANALGRFGVGIDLSAAYLRLARWRVEHSGHFAKVAARRASERPLGSGDPSLDHTTGQGVLL